MRKFQIIQKAVSGPGVTISFDEDIEKGYDTLEEIAVFSDAALASNENLNISQELKVDDIELYPENFPTQLLHPEYCNGAYRKLPIAMPITKHKLRGKMTDLNTSVSPYTITLMLTISNSEQC